MPLRKKTCRNFQRGCCQNGESCKFRHVNQEQVPLHPFGIGAQMPDLAELVVHNTFLPQMPGPLGFGVQNTFQPQMPNQFGPVVENSYKNKRFKRSENKWIRVSSASGGDSSALQNQDNQPSTPTHVPMKTDTPMQDLTGQQEIENQSSQSHDYINIESDENEINEQHVNEDASVEKENTQNLSGQKNEVVLKHNRQKSPTMGDDYIEVTIPDENEKVERVICKKLTKKASGAASTSKKQMQSCLKCKQFLKKPQLLNFQPTNVELGCNKPPLHGLDAKYDANKMRESIANWLMATEQPFTTVEDEMFICMMKTANPMFERLPTDTIKSDCFKVYELEKKKLKALINDASNICLTIDGWKSPHQGINYMVITGHFVNQNWRLQKRVLSVVHVSHSHNGSDTADAIYKCLEDCGIEGKIFSISMENASYNDMVVSTLKTHISKVKKLPCSGKLFHVSCCARIVNLLAKDGLSKIDHVSDKVREAIKYINHSEARRQSFSNVAHHLQVPDRKLLIDIPTRWNSTYDMLSLAIKFKDVFPRYAEYDPHFGENDWNYVQSVCDVLKVFKACTNVISSTYYPTANLYLLEVYKVKETLDQGALSENEFIRTMTQKMKEQFDKYWEKCHLLMAMAAVLDPRLKKQVVEFCYPKIYPPDEASVTIQEVIDALELMYEEYLGMYDAPTKEIESPRSGSSEGSTSSSVNEGSGWDAFGEFLKDANVGRLGKSELQIYLEEGVLQGNGGMRFNVLDWWNTHKFKYRILSKMALDILAIPISIAASESTFSTGERVIDSYHSTLAPTTVEMLIRGGDWVGQLHGVKKLKDTPDEIFLPSGKRQLN